MPISAVTELPAGEKPVVPQDVQKEILRIISGIDYGSVEIVIHGRQVVQIEARQKKRFGDSGKTR